MFIELSTVYSAREMREKPRTFVISHTRAVGFELEGGEYNYKLRWATKFKLICH